MMAIEYPWYLVVEGSEQPFQGDLVTDCAVLVPEAPLVTAEQTAEPLPARVLKYNVVVLTQSCDLLEKKVDLVLVSPYWSLSEFSNRDDFLKSKKGKEQLRRGNLPGYHLLNRSEIGGFETDLLVVDFRSVYSIPYETLTELLRSRGKRLRLLPPYREHLSQAFARFLMRVGLPVDIPPFE